MKRVGLVGAFGLGLGLLSSPLNGAEEVQPSFQVLERGSDAMETFRLNALGIVSSEVEGSFPTLFVFGGNWWRATRGKFRWATRYDDFFRLLGRDDLAEQHARRRAVAMTLFWTGLAAQVGGATLFFVGLYDQGFGVRSQIGLGLFVGGFAASAIGATRQHPALSEEDAVQMTSEYNRRLRLHLGLGAVSLRGGF